LFLPAFQNARLAVTASQVRAAKILKVVNNNVF